MVLGPLKIDTQQQPYKESFFLIFLTFSFSGTTSLQVLRKPGSCQTELNPTMSQSQSLNGSWGARHPSPWIEPQNVSKLKIQWVPRRPDSHQLKLNPTMSQSWNPSGSWKDQTPVSLKWTPQSARAEAPAGSEETRLPSAWTNPTMSQSQSHNGSWGARLPSPWIEPQNVSKLKPQWVLRRPDSCQQPHAARCSVRAGFPLRVGVGSRRRAPCSLPANENCRSSLPHWRRHS